MDAKLTEALQRWLDTAPEQRDAAVGNELLLRFSGNKIRFRNISHNPARHIKVLEYELGKYLKFRLAKINHEEFTRLHAEAEKAWQANFGREESAKTTKLQKGRRADHDSLPEDIRRLYEEIPELRQKMRLVHTRLENLSDAELVCPDSDRYPFVVELLKLNRHIRDNWATYDAWSPENPTGYITPTAEEISHRALAAINLNKGKYARNPTKTMREKLQGWYGDVLNPTEKLKAELKELGII